ncbi:hypothetical protein FO440_23470 [Mucilaginibacter corticis]|uniref:RNA polymerase sigma-70 region 2 domain-containing protein n=1 Tax=Mucilaginibacter corticis TaxID=2597670 RepID=A0A556M7M5_9SPHI|nr:hypothetical protein [Mucilaginibacter corticis]TSJ35884.1 hypothetical protein FO440_23470 [Mucilaginibacter corticis]
MNPSLLAKNELLKLIRAKSRVGAEGLYDQYAVVLRLAIFRITGDRDLSNIVLEKTLHKIWDSAALYNEQETPLLTWMLVIAKGLALENRVMPAATLSA